jgi:hypothetical protein
MSEPAKQGTEAFDNIARLLQQSQSGSGSPTTDLVGSLLGGMSTTVIVINVLAGIVGAYYFMFGRRRQNIPMVICGVVLCVVPYFISNVYLLTLFCLILAAVPFVVGR